VRILITWSQPHPEMANRELKDIAREWNCSERDAAERLLPAGAVYFQLDEADVSCILSHPRTMIGSDGLPHDKHPHPRLWGTFPRVLGHYSRDLGMFSLEAAVFRMTGLPAEDFGIEKRGRLAIGNFADVVVFDAESIGDRATFADPQQPSAGIDLVLVNAAAVWRGGKATGARPGRVLHPSSANGRHIAEHRCARH
jgi:N-acyl-D-amino-acid deacylase